MTGSKTILVTGGAGFLGSFLCERLIEDGHDVLCVDNFHTGRRRNIAHLVDMPGFELLRHDVTEPFHIEVDQVYNLACPASPIHYQNDPVRTVRTNVHGAINVLELGRRARARVFQASTSEVYGDPEVHPQREGYFGNVNPVGPRACYDEGKRCAETLFVDYARQHRMDVRIARIFNTYGPRMRMDDGRVVSNFIVQALRGEPITLFGGGTQTRSFCFVDDLVRGIVALMEAPAFGHAPCNLGNPTEFTVRELARIVVEMTGSSSPLVDRPLPQDDPTRRRPDISRARERLGWEPRVALRVGLERTIAHFEAELSEAVDRPRRRARVAPAGPAPAAKRRNGLLDGAAL